MGELPFGFEVVPVRPARRDRGDSHEMSVKKRIVRAKTPSGLVLALALQALKHDAVQSQAS
ncbi:MAG: hypothetical protein R2705_02235 [Ilumatobacteraceae bacterium]